MATIDPTKPMAANPAIASISGAATSVGFPAWAALAASIANANIANIFIFDPSYSLRQIAHSVVI